MNADDWKNVAKLLCGFGLSVVLIFCGGVRLGNEGNYITQSVAMANQHIMANRNWRKSIFWFLVPSGWDRIQTIPMPEIKTAEKQ